MEIVCKNCADSCEENHGMQEEGIAQAQAHANEAPPCRECGCLSYEPIPVVEED